jgi:hypothetical protein
MTHRAHRATTYTFSKSSSNQVTFLSDSPPRCVKFDKLVLLGIAYDGVKVGVIQVDDGGRRLGDLLVCADLAVDESHEVFDTTSPSVVLGLQSVCGEVLDGWKARDTELGAELAVRISVYLRNDDGAASKAGMHGIIICCHGFAVAAADGWRDGKRDNC